MISPTPAVHLNSKAEPTAPAVAKQAPAVIEIHGLSKRYAGGDAKPALNNLDLQVYQGEIFGYLGPNGAGKTTTIRLLLDIIRPTSGTARILGLDTQADAIALHGKIGYLPGELNLWGGQTGAQVVRYLGKVHGGVDQKYVGELCERLSLDLSKYVRAYSSGNRRKLGLVLALMHRPDVLILDEPTNGLDPLMQKIFHEIMLEQKAAGRTVFLSSHILSEVQAICERVGILRDGELKAVERVTDLTRVNFNHVTITFHQAVSAAAVATIPGVSDVSAEGPNLQFKLSGDLDPVLRALTDQYIVRIHAADPTLEEIFLTYYGNGARLHETAQPTASKKASV